MKQEYEYIVLGLEQYSLDHVRGGSQDHSRIMTQLSHAALRRARQAGVSSVGRRRGFGSRWRGVRLQMQQENPATNIMF